MKTWNTPKLTRFGNVQDITAQGNAKPVLGGDLIIAVATS